jgi:hypothetical protein
MGDFGNGIAVTVKAFQDDFDLVDVLWCATPETAWLYGVVDAGVRRHGGQAQGGAQADAVNGHLVDTVFHRGEAVRRRVSGAFTLSTSCFTNIFNWSSSASRAARLQGNGISFNN